MPEEDQPPHSRYRSLDTGSVQLLTAWPKVLEILNGGIPEPEVVEIFLTGHCQFACPHCRFQSYLLGTSSCLRLGDVSHLLTELHIHGVQAIELSGGGEPLLHPDISRVLAQLARLRLQTGLISNGYQLVVVPDLVEQVAQCCNWVRISIDAFTEETFCRVHGRTDISYMRLKSSIASLAQSSSTKIGIKMLISRLNQTDCLLGIAEAQSMGVDYLQFKFLAEPSDLAVSPAEAQVLARQLLAQLDENDRQGSALVVELVPPYLGQHPSEKCLMSFLHPVVNHDGRIYICPFFEHRVERHALGSIHEGGFYRHWGSQRHRDAFTAINLQECVPNCPMSRYKPVIEFIKSDAYRFKFI